MEQKSLFVITEVAENKRETVTTTVADIEMALCFLEEQGYEMINDRQGRKHSPHLGFVLATITQVPVEE